jgi:hypothetical protein
LPSFDQEYPIDCDDEFWDHPDPEKAFKQPDGKPSTVSCWVHLLKLLDILSFAQSTIVHSRIFNMGACVDIWYSLRSSTESFGR